MSSGSLNQGGFRLWTSGSLAITVDGDAAASLADIALDHPEEAVSDLVAVATARSLDLPLLTGLPHLAALVPEGEVIVLPRRPS